MSDLLNEVTASILARIEEHNDTLPANSPARLSSEPQATPHGTIYWGDSTYPAGYLEVKGGADPSVVIRARFQATGDSEIETLPETRISKRQTPNVAEPYKRDGTYFETLDGAIGPPVNLFLLEFKRNKLR